MTGSQGLLLCLLLVGTALGQTDFKNTCQKDSLIPKLATGLIHLNPLDTYNNGANKDYYQDLRLAQFAAIDVLGHGFALTGFQTGCTNTFYTLVIDRVAFENQNTRMRIVVNFRNPADNSITLWSLVSFTYVVVSRNLNGAYSNIWATVAEIRNPAHQAGAAPIDSVAAAYQTIPVTPTQCRTFTDPSIILGASCSITDSAAANGDGGGDTVIHAYIMGFMWNTAASTTSYLNAGVLKAISADYTDENTVVVSFGAATVVSRQGPNVEFYNPTSALEYIKVAFVLSRYDSRVITLNTYPSGSLMLYSASYIYTAVTTFNSGVAITRGTGIAAPNNLYYHLPDTRYAIYGITKFNFPKSATVTCSTISINATLNSIDTFTITSPNTLLEVFFVADIFTKNVDFLCNDGITPIQTQILAVGQKSFFTVPTQSREQFILEDSQASQITVPTITGDTFNFNYFGAMNGNQDTILYEAQVPFIGLTVGAPLKFEFGFFDSVLAVGSTAGNMKTGTTFNIQLAVNGFVIYSIRHLSATPGNTRIVGIFRGLNSNSATANAVITISFVRATDQNIQLWTYLRMYTSAKAYDPSTGCCVTGCPTNTGLDVQARPPTCIYCNTQAGLVYSPSSGSCACISGFYLEATKTFQCYPCSALYCAICSPATPSRCTTCVVGANLNNVTFNCTCGNGFFINGTQCQKCPSQCQNCSSPLAVCTACVDSTRRDITQNCKCITGFFDAGAVNCSTCSQTCLTCTNATGCTSCDATRFRNLTGSLCTCIRGYYELYHTNLTRTCEKCNPECLTCTTSPALCTACDSGKNRVAGTDNSGRQTCLCLPGFYSTADGSCVQSNCNADPFCSVCEQGLKLCIQCLTSKNRVIKLPESICVCMEGYYPDSNNTCVPCARGCGICMSATNCTSCVALATPAGDGSCNCPRTTYFTVSPDGVRYCSPCGSNCVSCLDAITCITCATSYAITVDQKCICAVRNYVSPANTCLPCPNGCQNCSSATQCNSCIVPLLLQGTVCRASCSDGSTPLGSVCVTCSTGCQRCTENLICYYCNDGFYTYKGNCYQVCPAGTIGDKASGNWNCVPCNEPCKTCINHPSYCTSCLNGMGYLQTSANMQSCVLSCVAGTFISDGVCRVCDFRCDTCLGSSINCISCPGNQILYKGSCWAVCPAIQMQSVGIRASCEDNCPDAFYKLSATKCAPCSIQCTTCSGGPSNCTSCLHGSVSTNGTCSVTCGENQFSFQGICVACAVSCYGCQFTPQNCLSCAIGYVKTGSICQKGCLSHQFFESQQQRCISCGSGCGTCSSFSFCTTCANSAITPRGGVCSTCPYPCATCDGSGACTSCLSGFYYFQNACQTSCPAGANPVNGVCTCSSGIVSMGQCVTSCGSGFTSIGGSCQPCNANCAECSRTINTCTKCISGFLIDTSSRRCVSQAQCSYGQDYINGACSSICDSGFNFYEGICIYGGCFTGYAPNAFGGCVRQGQVARGPTCNSNQFISNGACVGSCRNGFYPDSTSRQCLPCSSNCLSCFSSNFCIICGTGFEMSGGVCVPSTTCSSNQFQYNKQCIDSCPIGTYSVGSQCMRSCPVNTYLLSQICYISCPTSLRTNEACLNQCPTGTTNTNGVCA